MGYVVLFLLGWALRHAFDEKSDEYRHSQQAHREKYLARLSKHHPTWDGERKERYLKNAARRNTAGHFAYLLRHGWWSTGADVVKGWEVAKAEHEKWRQEHPKDDKPSRWRTFRAGWGEAKKARPETPEPTSTAPDPTPTAEPSPRRPETPEPSPAEPELGEERSPWGWLTEDEARDAEIIPWPTKPAQYTTPPGSTAGSTDRSSTPMEAPKLDAARMRVGQIGEQAAAWASGMEQIKADAMVYGLTADGESMAALAAMEEALRTVTAFATVFVEGSTNRHSGGEEYANSGHAVKNTDYLKRS